MSGVWIGAAAGALVGALVARALTERGLQQLSRPDLRSEVLLLAGSGGAAAAGAACVLVCSRLGLWALAPALLAWSASLVALACCDAVSQRVPTGLVRQTGASTAVLVTSGFAVHRDWSGLVISAVAVAASSSVALLCWRFAGAGFGDVRLAVLGGLGLGHTTQRGLLLAMAAVAAITVAQAGIIVLRGGDRRTPLPLGPALAVGFLVAGTV